MQIIIQLLLTLLALLVYYILIRPIIKLIRLKIKHGDEIYVKFYPFLGQYIWEKRNEAKYGYTFEDIKKIMVEYPKLKAIAFIFGTRVCISSVDPELSKSILLDNYAKMRKYLPIFNCYEFTKGLPFQEGDDWKQTRKVIADSFHFESLNSRFQVISDVIKAKINSYKQYIGKDYVPIFDEMTTLTGDIGIKVLFGPEFENFEVDGIPFSMFIQRNIENQFVYSKSSIYYQIKRGILGDRLAMKFLIDKEKKLLQKNDEMMAIIKKEVEKKIKVFEQNPQLKSDFLVDRLIKAYLNKSIPNLTIQKICIQCANFFFAALDTTGTLLGWIMYSLSEHKLEKQKVIEEINTVFPTQESLDNIQFDDLKKLIYTSAFIEESQRKYHSVTGIFHREVLEPFQSGKFEFGKDDLIHINFFAGFLNPREFKNNDQFMVERFLNGNDKLINPYIYLPFSAGPRNCIGKYLAQLEIKLTLVYFLKNYNVERNEQVKLVYNKKFMVDPKDQNLVKITLV